ncbi:conserved hypothetical protein (putative transposase or invertase) [Lachnospiraceae bacterium YSD2013]|nr:PD-(D/E)XK nuclease family transposase [Lachnospiraceae bacterium]SCX07380.1 conserved hypothetical protein (putative transposase or invertase) [Lachnospiraceae bacterium YSD2013]
MKEFKKLGFSDSFMFNKVMEDPELCRRVLETLLQTKLSELTMPLNEKEVKATKDGKAIRLDVYTRESANGTIYDTEMQNLNRKSVGAHGLPRRSRYYQAMIDINNLRSGESYQNLTDSNVVFICTFDPFGLGNYKYTFREYCEEKVGLLLDSGTSKYFFNTTATEEGIPQGIMNLYKYINTGEPSDELTGDIAAMVEKKKDDFELSVRYLREYFGRMDAKEEERMDNLVRMLSNGGTPDMLKTYLNATAEEIAEAQRLLSSGQTFSD